MSDGSQSMTLADVLRENRRSYPLRTAAVCGDTRLTWPELDARVNHLAQALRATGVTPGDRVLWLGQNCHRVLETVLAAAKLGAMCCPVNWRQSPDELAFVLRDADPRLVFWQEEEVGEAVRAARAAVPGDVRWVQHDTDGTEGYEAFLASGGFDDPYADADPFAPVLMLYTAAFEGRPNGALLSSMAILMQDVVMATLQRIDVDYVFLNSGPLFHVGTLMTILATFHMGGCNVFVRRVEPEELCRLIDQEHCTGAFLLPPTRDQLVAANADGRYDLTSLRAPAGPPEWMAMVTVDDSPWWRNPGGYGQTEVMGMATLAALGGPALGTHGRPGPFVQLRVVDDAGDELALGDVGEIVVRGPTTMVGYHARPEESARRSRGGWHHTGDLGRRETDGSVSFIGPATRMIKSAAENIYPAEVEAALARHPAVREAAVLGVPDPTWTQSVKAVVVLHEGVTVTDAELVEHCRAQIASYKKPRSVEFVTVLPRTALGIVDRDALDAAYGGGGYPGGTNRIA